MSTVELLLLGIYVNVGIVVSITLMAVECHEHGWSWRVLARGLFGFALWPVAIYMARRE